MPYADQPTIKSRSTRYLVRATPEQFAAGQKFADARINSKLANSRFKDLLPFDPVPDKIESIAADLAAYFVILDIFNDGKQVDPLDYANTLWDRANEDLEELVKEEAGLLESSPDEPLPESSVVFSVGQPGPLAQFDGKSIPHHPLYLPSRWPRNRWLR